MNNGGKLLQQALMENHIGEHESKYVFPRYLAPKLDSWLRSRCLSDPDYPIGTISSIYYDTSNWSLLHEKLNSDFLKAKIRLRWYSNIDNGQVLPNNYLEIKFKVGSSRHKYRLATGLPSDWIATASLSSSTLIELPRLLQQQGFLIPGLLYPTIQIDYTRLRFVDPLSGARLSVDHSIRVTRCNPLMLARSRPQPLDVGVFELKEKSGRLPDWLHQLSAFGCRRTAFSKYSACWQQVTNQQF